MNSLITPYTLNLTIPFGVVFILADGDGGIRVSSEFGVVRLGSRLWVRCERESAWALGIPSY